MNIYEVIQEEPLERDELGFGMSQYSNDNFVLSGGFRSGSSPEGTTRLKYDIYDMGLHKATRDPEKSKIGFTELFVNDETQEIKGLVNIELSPEMRKSGRGKSIIRDLKDTVKGGLDIHDIQKKAQGFWQKQGVDFNNISKTSGRINNEDISSGESDPFDMNDHSNFPNYFLQYFSNPGYFQKEKKIKIDLKKMPVDEFINISRKLLTKAWGQPTELRSASGRGKEKVEKYARLMKDGEKFPPLYLSYIDNMQDGLHRAEAAKLIGINTVPVYVARYIE